MVSSVFHRRDAQCAGRHRVVAQEIEVSEGQVILASQVRVVKAVGQGSRSGVTSGECLQQKLAHDVREWQRQQAVYRSRATTGAVAPVLMRNYRTSTQVADEELANQKSAVRATTQAQRSLTIVKQGEGPDEGARRRLKKRPRCGCPTERRDSRSSPLACSETNCKLVARRRVDEYWDC